MGEESMPNTIKAKLVAFACSLTTLWFLRFFLFGKDRKYETHPNRAYNIAAVTVYLLLVIIVGLPIWWGTTSVYRADLKSDEIANLDKAVLRMPVSIHIIVGDGITSKIFQDPAVEKKIESAINVQVYRHLNISLSLTKRESSESEKSALSKFDGTNLASLDESMSRENNGDVLEIFIFHGQRRPAYFGAGSRVYLIIDGRDPDQHAKQSIADEVVDVVFNGYLQVGTWAACVERHFKANLTSGDLDLVHKSLSNQTSSKIVSGAVHPKLSLEVHIVDPEPTKDCKRRLDEVILDEDVRAFLTAVRNSTDVTVKSQMLYYVDFPFQPEKHEEYYAFPAHRLPHLINPMEPYLGTSVTTEPVMHWLVYVTPDKYYPLHILDDRGEKAAYNSFVVSSWGGVTVVNVHEHQECNYDRQTIMNNAKMAMLANLRKMINLGAQIDQKFERRPVPLSAWELNSLRYKAIVENTFSSMRTLRSLTTLLEDITYIVISDDVARSVNEAVDELYKVLNATGRTQNVHEMLKMSQSAFEYSEKAFFDPTLLALLYFPVDQKYAIYLPLFMPALLPLLSSMLVFKYVIPFLVMMEKR